MNIPEINKPNFWNQKYIDNDFSWDISSPTPIFVDYFNEIKNKKDILIPGCGLGHDAIYLSRKGHNVTALDFSSFAINYIKNKYVKNNLKAIKQDFFELDSKLFNQFDIVLEYTFFCAIHPSKRTSYVNLVSRLLKKNGFLIAIFLPINKAEDDSGPPFGVDINKIIKMFSKNFNIIVNRKSLLSIPPRKDSELFLVMEKK